MELAPELYGLTTQSSTAAAAARFGVEQARAHCTGRGLGFEPVRTVIGSSSYQIAFRCPRPVPGLLTPLDQDATSPDLRNPSGLP